MGSRLRNNNISKAFKSFIRTAVIVLLIFSCSGNKYVDSTFHIDTVNNNVCKKLKDKVILYAVFVDTKNTNTWTTFDINSTLDSIRKAASWIEKEAKKNNVQLEVEVQYHQNGEIIPIANDLKKKTLMETILDDRGIEYLDSWADRIAKVALKAYGRDEAPSTKTKIKPKDRESLVSRLRDLHQTDNVGLVYFLNNYYTDEVSVALHTAQDDNPEYAIVSYKNPATIAHEYLHLFGALDLYLTPFDTKKEIKKRKAFVMKEFPDELMAFSHRRLNTLNLSPFTKYLVGWDNELDIKYKEMILGKKINVAKYSIPPCCIKDLKK